MENVLIFSIGSTHYCIDLMEIQEITLMQGKITRLQKSKDYIEGLMLLRNKTIEVIDTYSLLKVEKPKNLNKVYLIVLSQEDGIRPLALMVDEVVNIAKVENLIEQKLDFFKDLKFIEKAFVNKEEDKNDIIVLLNTKNIE